MATLTVVGVRHHSPACSRVVAHAIDTLRPRFVLIEGPADMNARLDELLLDHRLPVALYSYRLSGERGRARATWAPFCDYSPEWVALRHGRAAGAEPLFIDLPAWDDAFAQVENRYSDAHLNVSGRLIELARSLGFDSTDTLWDHLFEQPRDPAQVQAELSKYFHALRADEAPAPGDDRREAFMAQWIAWAMREAGLDEHVLAVCGGYHQAALERLWPSAPTARPEFTVPEARVGSYLVPFSFHRMDSFAGYASGMPSPGFYQACWDHPEDAPDQMLWASVARLRDRGQLVSTADAIAATSLTQGLAALRGHPTPLRADVLDGLTGALLKNALQRPPPWSTRGVLPPGSEPLLVELVATFSGDARGQLAPGTPRPPLLADVERELARVALPWTEEETRLRLDVLDPKTLPRRQLLQRLRLLDVPLVEWASRADLHRAVAQTEELWRLRRVLETEPALIERAVYGATLAQAALTRLAEAVQVAPGVRALSLALEAATLAGFSDFARTLLTQARDAVDREPSFAELGLALGGFLASRRALPQATGLDEVIAVALERALWLLEGMDGPRLPFDADSVFAVAAVRDGLKVVPLDSAVLDRRASAAQAPPAIRGACLGARWTLSQPEDPAAQAAAAQTLRAIPDAALGDFLSGLFALAREEFQASFLLTAVHERLVALGQADFLIALPSLRQAFAFFPPRERMALAKKVVAAGGLGVEAYVLLQKTLSPDEASEAAALEAAVFRTVETYGLLGARDE